MTTMTTRYVLTLLFPALLLSFVRAVPAASQGASVSSKGTLPQLGTSAAAYQQRVLDDGGRVDYVFGDDRPFAQCHASTVVQAADGALLCAWFGGTEEKNPDVSVWISRFDGAAWSKPVRTAKVDQTAHWNPVLFRDAEDTITLFFKVGVDEVHWRTYWTQSQDDGGTWSEPTEVAPGDVGGRGPVKNKPIILSDGTWLAPASTEAKEGRREIWKAFADRSVDRGKTWTRSADFAVPDEQDERFRGPGAIQPTFWESEPGRVHALVRTGAGIAWRTASEDGGATWSDLEATDLPNNNSGLDALRLEDGRVLLVYNPVGKNWGPRTPLDLAVSSDNGKIWKTIAHLEDDPDLDSEYSYPAIVRTQGGIAVCYTWNRERIRCWQISLDSLTVPDTG
jgi:predicted neuraminidase